MNTPIDAGRLVLSAAALGSGLTPIAADWNARHTFAPHWPPHARLHEAIAIMSQALFGGMALWLLWRPAARRAKADAYDRGGRHSDVLPLEALTDPEAGPAE